MCYLLQIRFPDELFHRAERGAVFESFVVSEMYKNFMHRGEQPRLYYWRTASGHEVDFLLDLGRKIIPVETKSAQTIAPEFFDDLTYWRKISGNETAPAAFIYGGELSFKRSDTIVYPWFAL